MLCRKKKIACPTFSASILLDSVAILPSDDRTKQEVSLQNHNQGDYRTIAH